MTPCQNCHAPSQLYLCESCSTQLANMLDNLPWLLDELDARIQKLDRINIGTIGRNRRPDELNIMDFDAAETARKVRRTLTHWCQTVAERHTGRQIPAIATVPTKNLARWLHANLNAITTLDIAGQLYRDIARLVGTGTTTEHRGELLNAIDRNERHFAGTCPTTTGHYPDGDPIECGTMLYADIDDRTTTCPQCGESVDVEKNQDQTAKSRDLRTTTEILEVLTNIDEPIDPDTLDQWIKAKRLRTMGWRHDGALVKTRVNEHSEALYSLKRVRKLRRRDGQIMTLRAKVKAR